jgi:hypothetical protein
MGLNIQPEIRQPCTHSCEDINRIFLGFIAIAVTKAERPLL